MMTMILLAAISLSSATIESPFACNIRALTPAQRTRHFDQLGPALRGRRTAVRELENGYEFTFAGDPKTVAMLTEWAVQERLCCPFFAIALQFEPEGGAVHLQLTGRKGTKDFIRVDGASWIEPVK
jgi:hypothetical protein